MKAHEYSDETKAWLERSKRSEQPYGHSHRSGTLLLSVIKTDDAHRTVAKTVLDAGFGWWRAIDEMRPRRMVLSAKTLSGRVNWDPGDRFTVNPDKAEIRIHIPQPHPEQLVLRDNDESCRFLVTNRGQETIDTSCSATKDQFKSSFFADTSGGPQMPSRDWLAAIARGIEGLPGGRVFLGPLIKLREDEKSAARNKQIDQMFRDNQEISQKILMQLLDLSQDNARDLALSELSTKALATEFGRERGHKALPPPEFGPTEFPFPVSKGAFIKELTQLWSSREEIRTCLRSNDYAEIEATRHDAFVIEFVDSMTGSDTKKLAQVFDCLSKRKPRSQLLAFAAAYLKNL